MKPIARVTGYHAGRCVVEPTNPAEVLPTGMALYDAFPPSAQAEISRLKAVIEKCKDGIECALSDYLPYINKCEEALAAIKEEGL